MKYLTTLVFVLLAVSGTTAQQIVLNGLVSIHNSKTTTGRIEPVKDAYVSAPFAKQDDTDEEGVFNLVFVGMQQGASIALVVEKAGFEVVNKRDLEDVVIGRRTPLKIFLTTKGQLAVAQADLYKVSLNALTARHDKLIAQLRKEGKEGQAVIWELEEKLNRSISNRSEAEKILEEQLESLKKQLPEIASELAATNLDFASDMYLRAFEHFRAGEIEKTIETLDEAVLDAEALEVTATIEMLDSCIIQLEDALLSDEKRLGIIIQTRLLKAHLSAKTNDLPAAAQQYEQTLELLDKQKGKYLKETVSTCWELASVYQKMGSPGLALAYQLKGVETGEAQLGENAPELLPYYRRLVSCFQENKDVAQAVLFAEKAYAAIKSGRFPSDAELNQAKAVLTDLYAETAALKVQEGDQAAALAYLEKALQLQPERKDLQQAAKKLKSKRNKN